MVLGSGVPVAATMQANRKAAGHTDANLDEIAYSDSLAQDCTAAIRTIQRKSSQQAIKIIHEHSCCDFRFIQFDSWRIQNSFKSIRRLVPQFEI